MTLLLKLRRRSRNAEDQLSRRKSNRYGRSRFDKDGVVSEITNKTKTAALKSTIKTVLVAGSEIAPRTRRSRF
jgi:hypothetical protein